MVVKTYRGLLATGAEDRIRLSTIKGKVGYRIIKFQVIAKNPGTEDQEATITISKESFTPSDSIDLSNSSILGVAFYSGASAAKNYPTAKVIIFDQEIVNQDIFVGLSMTLGTAMNYYIELEVIPLDEAGAEWATLKDMRSTGT